MNIPFLHPFPFKLANVVQSVQLLMCYSKLYFCRGFGFFFFFFILLNPVMPCSIHVTLMKINGAYCNRQTIAHTFLSNSCGHRPIAVAFTNTPPTHNHIGGQRAHIGTCTLKAQCEGSPCLLLFKYCSI